PGHHHRWRNELRGLAHAPREHRWLRDGQSGCGRALLLSVEGEEGSPASARGNRLVTSSAALDDKHTAAPCRVGDLSASCCRPSLNPSPAERPGGRSRGEAGAAGTSDAVRAAPAGTAAAPTAGSTPGIRAVPR